MEAYLLQESDTETAYIQLESGLGYILLEEDNTMADQIEIQMPQSIVAEETTFTVTSYHRTRASRAASAPTTVHYRLDCLATKTEILDWTVVSAPAASNSIVITSAQNQILDDAHPRERKQITIKLDSGLSTQVIRAKTWTVSNLEGIT